MSNIIDGKDLARITRGYLKKDVEELKRQGIFPKFAVIMVGDDKASRIYVKGKSSACTELGIEFNEYLLGADAKIEDLLDLIDDLNNKEDVHGILLQSPIPRHLDINLAFSRINPNKDVDGFHPINVGKLSLNQDTFVSCTPFGVIKMLEANKINIEGANAVVIGRSNIVGKPLIQCLLNKNATVTVCHSKTKNIKDYTRNADIVITAIGKPKFVTEDMIKEGAVVIDVGINRLDDGKVVGDVDFENVSKKTSYITPVPGGVGPMTIAMLMHNVVKAAKNI